MTTLTELQIDEIHERFNRNCKLLGYTPKGRLLTNDEAAEVCAYHPNTLEQKRLNGTGPAYIRPTGARRVLYSEPILLDWLASSLRTNTSA